MKIILRAFLRIEFFKLILIYNFKIELKKIILINSEKLAFIYIIFLKFFFDSNRGPTIIKLRFYVYHYTTTPKNYIVEIAYLILYRNLDFKGKIFKLFAFKYF